MRLRQKAIGFLSDHGMAFATHLLQPGPVRDRDPATGIADDPELLQRAGMSPADIAMPIRRILHRQRNARVIRVAGTFARVRSLLANAWQRTDGTVPRNYGAEYAKFP